MDLSLPIELEMVVLLLSISVVMILFSYIIPISPIKEGASNLDGWFTPVLLNPAKRQYEIFALQYTVLWIGAFAVVIILQLYEQFDAQSYMILCTSLAAPYLLQPFVYPMPAERNLPILLRYSFKANLWIAIFSFIGNYWYTHYFYSVLNARYTFPAHRFNDVPIALYFATHFYFVTYHTFSNLILRKIESKYAVGWRRTVFFWLAVLAFSYFTAYMETLTISSFPYYSFKDRAMMYRLGSAFYGLYFIVSFPAFLRIDEYISIPSTHSGSHGHAILGVLPHSSQQVACEALACGMAVLLLLDFCRLGCNIDLTIPGVAYYLYQPV